MLEKLRRLADARHQTVDEVLESLLAAYAEPLQADTPPRGTLAALAASAIEANIRGGGHTTARDSRRILNEEYAKYLQERQ